MHSLTPETDALWEKYQGLCLPRPHHNESPMQCDLRWAVEQLETERNEAWTKIEKQTDMMAGMARHIRELEAERDAEL